MSMFKSLLMLSGFSVFVMGSGWALTITPGSQWSTTNIPVCWEDFRPEYRQDRKLIRQAVKFTWEKQSAVRFHGWRKCFADSRGVRVRIQSGYPRTKARGKNIDGTPSGVILPSLWSVAALSINAKAPVHEFGHVLGFGHEHARKDNPDVERCGVRLSLGQIYQEHDESLTPFDEDSIMVACVSEATVEFSSGLPKLSALDIFGLVSLYGSNAENILDKDEAGDRFGESLLVDDLNGDGVQDLVVGAPGEDDDRGAVYLYKGDKIAGFRPWHKFSWQDTLVTSEGQDTDKQNFLGAKIRRQRGSGPSVVSIYSNDDVALQFTVIGRNRIKIIDSPTAEVEPERSQANAPMQKILGDNPFDFPEWDADSSVVKADLNNDGTDEYIIGAARAGLTGSGAVIVLKQSRQGEVLPWYWFGQAF
ncbi:MAG: hypothetical protein AB8B79_05315 [Granulosicoccus sp.]